MDTPEHVASSRHFWGIGAALGLVGLLCASAYGLFQFAMTQLPDVSRLRKDYPTVSYEKKNLPLVKWQKDRPASWVSLSAISPSLTSAVVVSEDWAFFQHGGFDLSQIEQVLQTSWKKGKITRGASTITQQVARNVFLSQEKSFWRKFREVLLSLKLERALDKKRILEVYLNIAEWGPGIVGIGSASKHYFSKPPLSLTPKEGAFLAMLLPSPIRYGESFRKKKLTPFARRAMNEILKKMVQAGYLNEEQLPSEQKSPLPFEEPGLMDDSESPGGEDEREMEGPSPEESAPEEEEEGELTPQELFEPRKTDEGDLEGDESDASETRGIHGK